MSRIESLREACMHIERRMQSVESEKKAALAEYERRLAEMDAGRTALLRELQSLCDHASVVQSVGGVLRYCLVCGVRSTIYDDHPLNRVPHVLRLNDEDYFACLTMQPLEPVAVSMTLRLPEVLAAKYRIRKP